MAGLFIEFLMASCKSDGGSLKVVLENCSPVLLVPATVFTAGTDDWEELSDLWILKSEAAVMLLALKDDETSYIFLSSSEGILLILSEAILNNSGDRPWPFMFGNGGPFPLSEEATSSIF